MIDYAARIEAMHARDSLSCSCGHRSISHGYGEVIDGSGIGNGPCGFCDCKALEAVAR